MSVCEHHGSQVPGQDPQARAPRREGGRASRIDVGLGPALAVVPRLRSVTDSRLTNCALPTVTSAQWKSTLHDEESCLLIEDRPIVHARPIRMEYEMIET